MSESSDIGSLLARATAQLEEISDSARLDAELLLAKAINMPRSYLFAHPDDTLDPAAIERFDTALARRTAGEPMAYISGTREFWSLELSVSPATLVPRPETEVLVERALREIPRRAALRLLDLGTGSGAIALALARERPLCEVTAIDASEDALAVAELNARELALPNVRCLLGDWTAPVRDERFDLIVSNPPYVRADDPALERLTFEPAAALVAGADGLDAIRRLATECIPILVADGWLMIEHGADQQEAVASLLADNGWRDIECQRDYAGLPRVSAARAPAAAADGAAL